MTTTRVIIELEIQGDPDVAWAAVDSALDAGTIQDAILEYEGGDDEESDESDEEEENESDDEESSGPLEIVSAISRGRDDPSPLDAKDSLYARVNEVKSNLLTLRKFNGNLELEPTDFGIATAKGYLEDRAGDRHHRSPDDQLHDMLEYFLCNGWQLVQPEHVGALTDAPMISDDGTIQEDGTWSPATPNARVYAHMNYAVEDPIESWAAGKTVRFEGAAVEVKTASSKNVPVRS